MRSLLLACFAVLVCGALPAAEPTPAPEPKPIDLKSLPANQWVERPLSGWPGKTYYGHELYYGFCGAGDLGLVVFSTPIGLGRKPDPGEKPGTARILKFEAASGVWAEHAAAALDSPFAGKPGDGSPALNELLHGAQLCFDSDRNVLVGLTATDLDGRGRTIEFDLKAKTATGHKPDPSPPVVTAASLCYDQVNKEVVLATGGFSPVGGTDGTWLYDGAKKQWRRLETPKEVDEVRLPLQATRDRLIALRWLVWKNLEFLATEREKLMD
jgi:hypothetical protein